MLLECFTAIVINATVDLTSGMETVFLGCYFVSYVAVALSLNRVELSEIFTRKF